MSLNSMPLGEVQRRTATLQHPKRERMTNLVREVGQVTYTDPAIARVVVVENYGVIPLLGERRAAQAPARQLKISEPNSLQQSPMARQLHLELEAIRATLAPSPERTSVSSAHSATGNHEELSPRRGPSRGSRAPRAAHPKRLLPTPPLPFLSRPRAHRPLSFSPGPRSAFRRACRSSPGPLLVRRL